MLEIRRVAQKDVQQTWDFVAAYVYDSLEHDCGECDLLSVYQSVNAGYVDLWLVYDNVAKELVGAVTTSVVNFPLKKSLDIFTVTINAPRDAWFPLFETLEAYGRGLGCKDIMTTGRLGLAKVLPALGFHVKQVKMVKEIDDGQ